MSVGVMIPGGAWPRVEISPQLGFSAWRWQRPASLTEVPASVTDVLPLARVAKARWLQVYMRIPEAQAEAAAARALRDRLTPCEARHVEIIALAVEGAGPRALALLDEHLADYPRDELPLFLALGAFGLLGFSG